MDHKPTYMRQIRSFVRREGRMTHRQQSAIDELWPSYGIDFKEEYIDFSDKFAREAPLVLEVGFGMGESLLEAASQFPNVNFLGIEVHRPGVGNLLAECRDRHINNIRVMPDDAVDVLRFNLKPRSLAKIQIFFPDPWHKKRHNKRRLIQPAFLELALDKLEVGGVLHIATDWLSYAEHIQEIINKTNELELREDATGLAAHRSSSKFERRGVALGHDIWEGIYLKAGKS